MAGSRQVTLTLVLGLVLVFPLAGCGGDDGAQQREPDATATQATTSADDSGDESTDDQGAAALARRPAGEEGLRVPAKRARIVADETDLGRVLFDANGQVVYVFETTARTGRTVRAPTAWRRGLRS
jgi:hypothetical protein